MMDICRSISVFQNGLIHCKVLNCMFIYDQSLYNKFYVFRDRVDAGKRLSKFIPEFDFVVAIPAGGVPVAAEVAKEKKAMLKVLLVSKVLFPWTTEAGFGAVSEFGDVVLDDEMAKRLGKTVVDFQVKKTIEKIKRRRELIPDRFLIKEKMKGKAVLIDDGLATGYTMLTAIRAAKRFFDEVYVAVPTASKSAVELIENECKCVYVLNLRDVYPYAVADAYEIWYDVSEEEMLEILKEFELK